MKAMKHRMGGLLTGIAAVLISSQALAQSGHFLEQQTECSDVGTQVLCTGKVAGLGGTTFEIVIEGTGLGTVECTNPGGNVAPGQTKELTTVGSTGPIPTPRNGQYVFGLSTAVPPAPADSCPNPQWVGTVVDVAFTSATLKLYEDGVLVDTQTVPIP